ncbi:MAG: NADPH-dependent 7-cyano-7-deazaguanine reductase QueF [bacterium]
MKYSSPYLGRLSSIRDGHHPDILQRLPRQALCGDDGQAISVYGCDFWCCYEVSALFLNAKPFSVVLSFSVDRSSKFLVESKSLKLYLLAFNQQRFETVKDLLCCISDDLTACLEVEVSCCLEDTSLWSSVIPSVYQSLDKVDEFVCMDRPDISQLLYDSTIKAKKKVYTQLFRSLCPVTQQPDWATVFVDYEGALIDEASLLSYVCAYRTKLDFHEVCVDSMYRDLWGLGVFDSLTVSASFVRRGGISISPMRSSALISRFVYRDFRY